MPRWDLTGRDDIALTGGANTAVGFRCVRCGEGVDAVEVTTMGERVPRFIPAAGCACPGARCPWCRRRLDDGGCCPSLPVVGCWAGGLIIPIPDVA